MRRTTRTFMLGALTCAILLPALPAHARWEGHVVAQDSLKYPNTPIPDPTGIAYNAKKGYFFISDAEVDETPQLWHKRNLFIVGRGGNLKATRRLKMTTEPEGIAWWGAKGFLFVADDDQDLILRYAKGRDGAIGTGDDKVRKLINTRDWGSRSRGTHVLLQGRRADLGGREQPEGLQAASRPGPPLRYRGRQDREVRDGEVRLHRSRECGGPSGLEPRVHREQQRERDRRDHLQGRPREEDLHPERRVPPACNLTGLVFAPGTDGAPRRMYLTDKGVDGDFNSDPVQVNDGQLYQMRLVNQ